MTNKAERNRNRTHLCTPAWLFLPLNVEPNSLWCLKSLLSKLLEGTEIQTNMITATDCPFSEKNVQVLYTTKLLLLHVIFDQKYIQLYTVTLYNVEQHIAFSPERTNV